MKNFAHPTSVEFARRGDVDSLIQTEQFDIAARLAPLTAGIAFILSLVFTWLFWSPKTRAYFVGVDVLIFSLSAAAVYGSQRWRAFGKPDTLSNFAWRNALLLAGVAGVTIATMPVYLLADANLQERSVIMAACGGVIGTGMSLAVLPQLFFLYSGSIVAGSFIALLTTGEPFYMVVALLLVFYAAFLYFLSLQLSSMIANRVVDQINLERERSLTTLLLKDYEENANDWLWEADEELRVLHLSDRIADLAGIPRRMWKGENVLSLLQRIVAEDSEPALEILRQHIEARNAFRDVQLHVRLYDKDRWWLISGKPTYFRSDLFSGYRGLGVDITEKKRAEDQLSYLALHDGLTHLPNRAQFQKTLDEAIAKLGKDDRLAVLCLDLDEFKAVNDAFGHGAGDLLLIQIAERLRDCVSPNALVARLAGDEFAILLSDPDECEREAVSALGAAIIESIGRPVPLAGLSAHVGVSIGVAFAPDHGVQEIMRRADLALYQSKRQGKNKLHFYQFDMDEKEEARRLLAADLRGALDKREFLLYFQPLVNAATKDIQGFEALVRWRHPVRGFVSPAEFIPIAEETGVIVALGGWILEEACRIAASWPRPLRIAVNLSPIQLRYSDVPAIVATALENSGLDPNRLELELTETAFLESSQLTHSTIEKLRALGVRMSLDDFGTGYSSLSYLRRIPFDKIKIDRCFVQDLPNDARDLSIVRAVVDIATAMGMAITAEGVETDEQSRCLLQQGCHQLQGFLFSRPVPAEDAMTLICRMDTETNILNVA